MLHNSHKAVRSYRCAYLYPHCVFCRAPELFDFQVLLEPFEKEFNKPSVLIKIGDFCGCDMSCVGQKREVSVLLVIMESEQSQSVRVLYSRMQAPESPHQTEYGLLFHLCVS